MADPDIEVEGPDGQVFAFPSGTGDGVMRTALLKHYQRAPQLASASAGASQPSASDLAFGGEDPPPSVEAKDLPAGRFFATPSAADALVRGAADSLTLGQADRIAAGMGALTGVGGTLGDYGGNLDAQHAATKNDEAEHPIASTVGKVGGTVTGVAGLIKNGLTLAPKVAEAVPGLLGRALGVGADGAVIGGLEGAGHSENWEDVPGNAAKAAGTGASVGFGLPVAGSALAATYRAVAPFVGRAVDGVSRGASGMLSAATGKGISEELERLGPQAMLVDASPALQGLGEGVATKMGEGQTTLVRALEGRNTGRNTRLAQSVEDNLGPDQSPTALKETIADTRKAVVDPLLTRGYQAPAPFGPAVEELSARPVVERALNRAGEIAANEGRPLPIITRDEAGRVVPNGAAESFAAGSRGRLDSAIGKLLGRDGALAAADEIMARRSAEAGPLYDEARAAAVPVTDEMVGLLRRLRRAGAFSQAQQKMAVQGEPFDIGKVQTWDYMKRALDDRIGAAGRKGVGDDARIYTGLKRELTDQIDSAVPAYAEARRTFAGESDLLGALENGRGVWAPSFTREQLSRSIADLTPGEAEMFRLGAANALREKLANTGDAANLPHAVFGNEALRAKIAALAPSPAAASQFNKAVLNEHRAFSQASQPNVHAWKNAYDQLSEQAAKLGDTAQGRAIGQARDATRARLESIPEIRAALSKGDEYSRLDAALDRGGDVLGGGQTAIRPSDLAAEFSGMSGAEQAALRAGTRASIGNKVGTQANDLAALKKALGGEQDWNREKMGLVFGEEPTQAVSKTIDQEGRFAQTFADIARNSKTAPRQAASAMIDQAGVPDVPTSLTMTGGAARLAQETGKLALKTITGARSDAIRTELGDVLSRQGEERDRVVRALLGAIARRQGRSDTIKAAIGNSATAAGADQLLTGGVPFGFGGR